MTQASNLKIVVIEDSDDDFEAIAWALRRDGQLNNPIIRCRDGSEAMDLLFSKHADGAYLDPVLILLDLNLPGHSGKTLIKKIRSEARLNRVPVVVLTSSNNREDVEACYDAGANSYIVKPFNILQFFEAIKKIKNYWFEVSMHPRDDRLLEENDQPPWPV